MLERALELADRAGELEPRLRYAKLLVVQAALEGRIDPAWPEWRIEESSQQIVVATLANGPDAGEAALAQLPIVVGVPPN